VEKEERKMRVFLLAVVMGLLVALSAAPTFALANPNGTGGQPSQDCEDLGQTFPGAHSQGFERVAEPNYAGSEQNPKQGNLEKAVSQYDVACFQQASRG